MDVRPKIRRFFHLFLTLMVIYIFWSFCIDIFKLDRNIDDETIVPCLFFLPPLGFLAIGIALVRIIGSSVVLNFIKKRFRKKQG